MVQPGDVIEVPDLKIQPARPLDGAQFVNDLGASGHAARPSLKTQQRIARATCSASTRSSTSGTSTRRPRPSSTCWPTRTPTRSGGSRSTSTSPRRRREYTHQHFKGRLPVPPAHAHDGRSAPSARTCSRARPTATCAAPGSGRSARAKRRHPPALRLARARRPQAAAAPHAAPAPGAALEPQLGDRPGDGRPGAVRPAPKGGGLSATPATKALERAKVPVRSPHVQARPQARVVRARGGRALRPRPRDRVQDPRRAGRRHARRRNRPRRAPTRPEGARGGASRARRPRWRRSPTPSARPATWPAAISPLAAERSNSRR